MAGWLGVLSSCLICAIATLPAETLSQVLSVGQVWSVVADVPAVIASYVFVFITYVSFLGFCAKSDSRLPATVVSRWIHFLKFQIADKLYKTFLFLAKHLLSLADVPANKVLPYILKL